MNMVSLLESYENELEPEVRDILKHIRDGNEAGDDGIGVQFISEI